MSFTDSLQPIVDAINSGKRVTFFHGAGVSTGAGIPDFRSPKTGLYSNLAKLDLPYAEAVFDIEYFRSNPKAFYTLADELYPGRFNPTAFHYFVRLLQDKKLLKRIYTQNIDTLERIAGIRDEYIIEAHGSFANNHCIDCNEEMSVTEVRKQMSGGIPTCASCQGIVKPDIVFFGEGLPSKFFETWDQDSDDVELAIVAGTSLTVYPFASLPTEVDRKVTRVLVNKELVGDFKSNKRKNDIVLLSDCDSVAEALCEALGWKKDLERLKQHGRVELGADLEEEIEKFTQKMQKLLEEEQEEQKKEEQKKEQNKEPTNLDSKDGDAQKEATQEEHTEKHTEEKKQDTPDNSSLLSRLAERITGLKI